MSTSQRRQGQPLHLDLPNGSTSALADALPPVAAVFLILFDVKAGYTIAWKRCVPGLELDESVEFKSLPSGLHHVREDLIYFIHGEDYAGISAFKNSPSEEEGDRNALMLAVGALLPLSFGRMGKSWKHAEALKELACKMAQDPTQTSSLEEYWVEHQLREDDDQDKAPQLESPSADKAKRRQNQVTQNGHTVRTRNRAISTASALVPPGQALSPHHPALSLPAFLDTFGPLIFPIYKAALLRKRLLIVGHAPVELSCNFVYDISILSGIPSTVADLLPLDPLPTRLHPLFSVGIHEMSLLTSTPGTSPSNGWVACTTDDILALKPSLFDTLITLPPPHSAHAAEKAWPTIKSSTPSQRPTNTDIKATQRDLRRYRVLRRELQCFHSRNNSRSALFPYSPKTPANMNASTPTPIEPQEPYNDDETASTHSAELAEPQSWSALAYDSFMWWASAGEKRTDMDEEEEGDALLLRQRPESPGRARSSKSPGRVGDIEDVMTRGGRAGVEMTIIAYFHRFTTVILKTLADVVDAADDDADVNAQSINGHAPADDDATAQAIRTGAATRDGGAVDDLEGEAEVVVEGEDMARMGLDVWSESDREFVRGLVGLYWGRRCVVRGGSFDVCGVRLC